MSKAIEVLAKELGTEDWALAAAKAAFRWGEGKELEQADFEKAIAEVKGMKFYAYAPPPKEAPALKASAATGDEKRSEPAAEPAAVVHDDRKKKERP